MEFAAHRTKPQHDYPIQEVARKQFDQKAHLMEIDTWMNILFIQMEADYKEMHRLPPNLERSNPQPPTNSIK